MNDAPRSAEPLTLAIDIGGTRLKAGVLNTQGVMIEPERRIDTPNPATPEAVLEGLLDLAQTLGPFDRISIGFPGVVRHGRVLTAPNLGTETWRGYSLAAMLSERLGKPARMLNDATVQGLGVIAGSGLECVITLGTGMGFALFDDGRPAPHLELSQHPSHRNRTYDHWIGNAALKSVGHQTVEQAGAQGDRLDRDAGELRRAADRRRQRQAADRRAAAECPHRAERGRDHRRHPAVGLRTGRAGRQRLRRLKGTAEPATSWRAQAHTR